MMNYSAETCNSYLERIATLFLEENTLSFKFNYNIFQAKNQVSKLVSSEKLEHYS